MLGGFAGLRCAAGRDPHVALVHVGSEQQHLILLVDEEHAGGGTEDGTVVYHSSDSNQGSGRYERLVWSELNQRREPTWDARKAKGRYGEEGDVA